MKKFALKAGVVLALTAAFGFNSCIGSFALTNRLLSWNRSIGNKIVNELVFFAFWVLPVYEVTSIADLLVINSIEFWSGTNPMSASVKPIETDHGRYLVKCDGKGYDIESPDGSTVRLNFCEENSTWSVCTEEGSEIPFMTFLDKSHVKMITPSGEFMPVELSPAGVMAYHNTVSQQMAQN